MMNDIYSIEFKDGYARLSIGEYDNQFLCKKEDEALLTQMVDVIVNGKGLYDTDIVDLECNIENLNLHRFTSYMDQNLDEAISIKERPDAKATILFVIGCEEMGLYNVENIVYQVAKCYPSDAIIIFTAINSETIPEGCFTLCVME